MTQVLLCQSQCYDNSLANSVNVLHLTINIFIVRKGLLTASVISAAFNYSNCYNISLGRYCFTTPTDVNSGVTWDDANNWCTSHGLTLPVINNADVQLAIEQFAGESGSTLSAASGDSYYVWLDAKLATYMSSTWYWVIPRFVSQSLLQYLFQACLKSVQIIITYLIQELVDGRSANHICKQVTTCRNNA